jgi:hypothetical protein
VLLRWRKEHKFIVLQHSFASDFLSTHFLNDFPSSKDSFVLHDKKRHKFNPRVCVRMKALKRNV